MKSSNFKKGVKLGLLVNTLEKLDKKNYYQYNQDMDYPHLSIDELIDRSKKGESNAFNELKRRYKGTVRARIMISVSNPEDINDVEQDVWCAIKAKLEAFDPKKGTFGTWIKSFRIPEAIRDNLRKKNKLVLLSEMKHELESNSEQVLDAIFSSAHPFSIKERDFQLLNPEDYTVLCDLYTEALRTILLYGGPAHQTLIFCFRKLLSSWNTRGGTAEIVAKLSMKRLNSLSKMLLRQYLEEARIGKTSGYFRHVKEIIETFQVGMKKKLLNVLNPHNPGTNLNYSEKMLNTPVGKTFLKDYFGVSPRKNIADWTFNVKEKVLPELKKIFYIQCNKLEGVNYELPEF